MPLSEQGKKREQEILAQLKIIGDKKRSLEAHLKEDQKERKVVSHSIDQGVIFAQLKKEEKNLFQKIVLITDF